jgi:hypothetical protein
VVSNHEEHLSQKGEKKNGKEIKNRFTLGKIAYPCYILIQQNKICFEFESS